MIKSFADKRTAALFAGYRVRELHNQIQRRTRAKLLSVDAAKQLDDLRVPPGNRLEALHGDRRGQHSIRINDPWPDMLRVARRRGVECGSRGLPQGVKAMSIKREDVDTGRIDFAEVITGNTVVNDALIIQQIAVVELAVRLANRDIRQVAMRQVYIRTVRLDAVVIRRQCGTPQSA